MPSTRKSPPIIAFTDCETTGLDPFLHDPWEIAVILRVDGQDEEHVFRIEPDLTNADPAALSLNRYHERTSRPDWRWDDRETAARRLHTLLDGAVIVGSNPPFDVEMITHLLGRYFDQPRPWHYRAYDIVTLAVGALYGRAAERTRADCDAAWYGRVARAVGWPWRSHDVSRTVQIEPRRPRTRTPRSPTPAGPAASGTRSPCRTRSSPPRTSSWPRWPETPSPASTRGSGDCRPAAARHG